MFHVRPAPSLAEKKIRGGEARHFPAGCIFWFLVLSLGGGNYLFSSQPKIIFKRGIVLKKLFARVTFSGVDIHT
jgi:hypothetical protein